MKTNEKASDIEGFSNATLILIRQQNQRVFLSPALPASSKLKLFDLPSFKFRVIVRKKYSVFFC